MSEAESEQDTDLIPEPPYLPVPYISGQAAHDTLKRNLEFSLSKIVGIDVSLNEHGTFYKVKDETMAFISNSLPSSISSYIEDLSFYTYEGKINRKKVC